jgi:hypothetical protein
MASETDFLNNALGMAGTRRISSIDENTVEAGWCRTYYPSLRRATQRMANWKFNGARLQLTLDSTAPAFGMAYSFSLPSTLLKLRVYNGIQLNIAFVDDPTLWQFQGGSWRIEGRRLYANDAAVFIEYNQDVSNPDLWDALYYEMLAAWLASKLSLAISKDTSLAKSLLEQAMGTWMPMALAVDGQEQSVPIYQSDNLVWGRGNF